MLHKPCYDLNHPILEKAEIEEAPEFKEYIEYNKKGVSAEDVKKLTKELEDDWQEHLKKEREKPEK